MQIHDARSMPPFVRPQLGVRAGARLGRALVATRLSPDLRSSRKHYDAFYRELWTKAAAEVELPARLLTDGAIEITIGGEPVCMRGPQCSIDDLDATSAAADKQHVYGLLEAARLPVPPHEVFAVGTLDRAVRFLDEAPVPCVVKPARGTAGGVGVTTGVRDRRDLRRACVAAAAAGARAAKSGRGGRARSLAEMVLRLGDVPLLIEHQIAGSNYRLLYLDGVLVDAIRRDPPTVTGDGRSSVAALLDQLNSHRLRAGGQRAQSLVNRDLDMVQTIARQGLTLDSVPPAGTEVQLKTTINENAPEDNRHVGDELCASIVEQAARAAALVGRFVGIDLITTDPTVPLSASGGCLLEANVPPGLSMHYTGRAGAAEPATVLLRHLCTVSASGREA